MNTAQIVAWVFRGLTALIFLVMGVNHFRPRSARGMARIVPPSMRREGILRPINLVYFTGVCELAGGIGVLLPWTRLIAAIALVVFLIAVFPANAYASQHPEKFGRAAIPFWPRLLAQVLLIALVLVAGLLG
ncbi:MAG TPA: hypothetical protein VGF80_03305 [Galbitalea sp.]|jgi:uncharacterized membrane protein